MTDTYNLCVIDDSIPVNGEINIADNYPLSYSVLKLLLEKQSHWDELEVKTLITNICASADKWRVYAFTDPNIYLNAVEYDGYAPDIIIYDWEYPTVNNPAELLREILDTTYAIVYIFTGGDHRLAVEKAIMEEPLKKHFGNRLHLLMKSDVDAPQKLLSQAEISYKSNFSFHFGSLLRKASGNSVEKILIALGAHHINFISDFLSEPDTKQTDVKTLLAEKIATSILEDDVLLNELVNKHGLERNKAITLLQFIKARFRDEISTIDIDCLGAHSAGSATDIAALQELWSYRLYFNPSDKLVRKGDIVQKKGTDNFYLVMTSDCQLSMFWHKNWGHVILTPLWNLAKQASVIKDMLGLTRQETGRGSVKEIIKETSLQSISNHLDKYPEGCFFLPYVKEASDYAFYLGFSKAAFSIPIKPKDLAGGSPITRKYHCLDYDHWTDFERITTISEPFVMPIIQNAFDALLGLGTPDYPDVLKADLNNEFKKMHDFLWPSA